MNFTFELICHIGNENSSTLMVVYEVDEGNLEADIDIELLKLLLQSQLLEDSNDIIGNFKKAIESLSSTSLLLDGLGYAMTSHSDFIRCHNVSNGLSQSKKTSNVNDPIHIWIIEQIDVNYCPVVFGLSKILHCACRLIDTSYNLCFYCRKRVGKSLLQYEGNFQLQTYSCDANTLDEIGLIEAKELKTIHLPQPIELYFHRKYFQDVIRLQQNLQLTKRSNKGEDGLHELRHRIQNGLDIIKVFRDENQQKVAKEFIDEEKIALYSQEMYSQEQDVNIEILKIRALLRWFKRDFFQWMNQPSCCNLNCLVHTLNENEKKNSMTHCNDVSASQPTLEEREQGWAQRVEAYQCIYCQTITRFPRYNNPSYMMSHPSRRFGRCGEFANVFGLICASLGFQVCYVLDFTDHVWIEVWIESYGRFIHVDACEEDFDNPLLYELGWGKKLEYILLFNEGFVKDVTSRYSRKLHECIMRRELKFKGELTIANIIRETDKSQWKRYQENNSIIEIKQLKYMKASLEYEMKAYEFLEPPDASIQTVRGRVSGDLVWRRSRGEI